MNISFHSPELLWLLLMLPLVALLRGRRGKSAAIFFSSVEIAKQVSKQHAASPGNFLFFLRLMGCALLIVGLARPQLGQGHTEVDASGIDIMLALDVSSSMLALDFSEHSEPVTRLAAVKAVVEDFIQKRPHDRLGIVAFAGNPYLLSPLTLNHGWLETNLERLQVGLIEDGTAIGSALGMSVNRLRDLPAKSRIVILLSDGVNNRGTVSPIAAAEAAASFDTKVYTIAVGRGGVVPTLIMDDQGQPARDIFGRTRVFQADIPVDEGTLQEVANITGGHFFRARDKAQLKAIYDEIDKLEKTDVKLRHYASYQELFWIPVVFGLLVIGLEQGLANTRYRRLP